MKWDLPVFTKIPEIAVLQAHGRMNRLLSEYPHPRHAALKRY